MLTNTLIASELARARVLVGGKGNVGKQAGRRLLEMRSQ